GPSASRRGREAGLGSGYSLIAKLSGSMVAILLVPNSTKTGTPLELINSPYGRELGVGEVTSLISPVFGSSRPSVLATCAVNHTIPLGSIASVCGSLAVVLYSVTLPVLGSSLPIRPR